MGVIYSNCNIDNVNNDCLICWDHVDNIDLIKCCRCNIKLHAYCKKHIEKAKGIVNAHIVNKSELYTDNLIIICSIVFGASNLFSNLLSLAILTIFLKSFLDILLLSKYSVV